MRVVNSTLFELQKVDQASLEKYLVDSYLGSLFRNSYIQRNREKKIPKIIFFKKLFPNPLNFNFGLFLIDDFA